jgi:hypothetical protein
MTFFKEKNKQVAEVIDQYQEDDLADAPFDEKIHEPIDLERNHTFYRRFLSRYTDYSLEFNDKVNVMIPNSPESSTVL